LLGSACRIAEVLDVEAELMADGHELRGLEGAGAVEAAAKKLVVHVNAAREFADRDSSLGNPLVQNIRDIQWEHLPFLGQQLL